MLSSRWVSNPIFANQTGNPLTQNSLFSPLTTTDEIQEWKRHYYVDHFPAKNQQMNRCFYTVRQQTKCILHGESAMRDYLNADIDSSCVSLSREDPMLFGIPRRVVPPLIICDSWVRDAQMTKLCIRIKQKASLLDKACFRHCRWSCLAILYC